MATDSTVHWLPPGCQHIITLSTLHEGWEGPSAELHLPQGHCDGLRETVGLHPWDLHEARRWPLLWPLVPPSPCSLCCTRSPSPHTPALSSHLGPCAHRHTPTLTSLVHRAGTHSTCLEQFPRDTQPRASAHPHHAMNCTPTLGTHTASHCPSRSHRRTHTMHTRAHTCHTCCGSPLSQA